jgi:Nuclear cap-binding protein subunit 3
VRPDALHVYGVDLVGTRDLLAFFSTYGPTYVEWIDDSSCNVLFPDEFTVKRLLVQIGEALAAEEVDEVEGAQRRCS